MTDDFSLEVEGMDDLIKSFETLVRKYPDRAGDLLVRQARNVRKDVAKLVRNDTDSPGTSKRSLTKLKEYKISKVQGIGERQYIEVSGKAPHFHLLENGHRQINAKGESVGKGFVPGYHFFDRASKKRQIEIPKDLESVIDKMLKEGELI